MEVETFHENPYGPKVAGFLPDFFVKDAADASPRLSGSRRKIFQIAEIQIRGVKEESEPFDLLAGALRHEEYGAEPMPKRIKELILDSTDIRRIQTGELAFQDPEDLIESRPVR